MMDTLFEDVSAFMIISRWFRTRVRNFSDKRYRENQNTLLCQCLSLRKSFQLWENVKKNMVEADGSQMKIQYVAKKKWNLQAAQLSKDKTHAYNI